MHKNKSNDGSANGRVTEAEARRDELFRQEAEKLKLTTADFERSAQILDIMGTIGSLCEVDRGGATMERIIGTLLCEIDKHSPILGRSEVRDAAYRVIKQLRHQSRTSDQ